MGTVFTWAVIHSIVQPPEPLILIVSNHPDTEAATVVLLAALLRL